MPTPIDIAHAAHAAAPADDRLHMRFLERVLDAELFVLLEGEADTERPQPRIFSLENGRFVLAFDTDERLAEFLDVPEPYMALSGRALVGALAGQGVGLALNAGTAASETLLSAEAIAWMAEATGAEPLESEALPRDLATPVSVPDGLLDALGPKILAMTEMIDAAYLSSAHYADGSDGLILAVTGTPQAARGRVARAIAEAVQFGGFDGLRLDVTFLDADASAMARITEVSLRIEMPEDQRSGDGGPAMAPGTDPDRPPRLR